MSKIGNDFIKTRKKVAVICRVFSGKFTAKRRNSVDDIEKLGKNFEEIRRKSLKYVINFLKHSDGNFCKILEPRSGK